MSQAPVKGCPGCGVVEGRGKGRHYCMTCRPFRDAVRYRRNLIRMRHRRLPKPAVCPRCGRTDLPIQRHHPDWSRPEVFEYFCRACHWELFGCPRVLQVGSCPRPAGLARKRLPGPRVVADPAFRDRILKLYDEEKLTLTQIGERLGGISRQAVSLHMRRLGRRGRRAA